jgi:quercetin dioxygenase-like cupin family protein
MCWASSNAYIGEREMTDTQFKSQPVIIKDAIEYASKAIVSKTLIKRKTGTLTLFSFDAGQELSEHTAPFDAAVLILDGTAEVTIGGVSHSIKNGEFVIMPADIPHSVKALQKFKMLLMMIKEG